MPGLRRLCDPQGGAADHAGDRRAAREHRVRQRHRLLVALPLLHGDLRLPHHPRPRAGGGDGGEARQSRARRVDHHRRRRRAVDRGQPHDAPAAPEPRLPGPAVQQRDLRADQGAIFADLADRHAVARRPRSGRSIALRTRARSRWARARGSSRAGSTSTRTWGACSRPRYAHKGTSFVEIFQNCIVYNDNVFAPFTEKKNAATWPSCGSRTASR